MKLSLNGDWQLFYHLESSEMPPDYTSWQCIPAAVPGNVELDLMRAGIEDDPFYGVNIYNYRKYEFYSWCYRRSFAVPADFEGEQVMLSLAGVDTYAEVRINDIEVGRTENMMIGYEFDVTSALKFGQENIITVRISSALNKARQREFPVASMGNDNTDEFVWLRKPPHSFGWDIAPRIVSAGIWRGIELAVRPKTRLTEVYYIAQDSGFHIRYRFTTDTPILDGFSVRARGRCGDSTFTAESGTKFCSDNMYAHIDNPKRWYPKGYGEANLYEVTFELLYRGMVLDSRTEKVGLRHFEIEKRFEPNENGEFKIKVNGTPILAKGSNWVPVDALHSRDKERLPQALALLDDIGCNIVRCWGGNVYEDDIFYDFCDSHGIMVWQDFAMACGIYPQCDEFAEIMRNEAEYIVKRLRNHTCILTWAGDNEVDGMYYWIGSRLPHSRYNRITREVLPRVIGSHDPMREYIPSSPYIPDNMVGDSEVPEQHNWGPRDYFKGDFYKHSTAHFISECGYHGCPSFESLAKYIPTEELHNMVGSDSWDTHNTDYIAVRRRGYNRNELMTNQVKVMFGDAPEKLEDYSIASQISQAEAKKFFIETTRLKKWRRTGIIWWNLIDGWPQISDAVVDYYFDKKLAYHFIKRIQQPICMMLTESEGWGHRVILGNDSLTSCHVDYTITDADTGAIVMTGGAYSPANENVHIGNLPSIPGEQKLYLINWKIDGRTYKNHYITGYVPYNFEKYKVWLEKILDNQAL